MSGQNQQRVGSDPGNHFSQPAPFGLIHLIRARQHHDMSSTELFAKFAQKAARKHSFFLPRFGSIDEDDVQIARQAAMLKAIIEDQDFGSHADGLTSKSNPITALEVQYARQVGSQQARLIVGIAP